MKKNKKRTEGISKSKRERKKQTKRKKLKMMESSLIY
jgi:hypothetical protein